MTETEKGFRGHRETRGRGASTKTTFCSIWVKSRGMIYSKLGVPPHPLSSSLLHLPLGKERETGDCQKERTLYSPGDQRHCGVTLKLKIQISMYSQMGRVCVTTRHQARVCQLEPTEGRVQSSFQLSPGTQLFYTDPALVGIQFKCVSINEK